ncbi:MAG: LLM class flavin-dependent oxidoreductase [Omnitrophica WOR_2 bacterium]
MAQKLRFGILTIQDSSWATLVQQWQRVESLGFDSVWIADHFVNSHKIDDSWLEGWTALAALATQTSRIQIGPLVTNIIYRNPALLAKEALTVDHISNGRLAIGIGATSGHDPSQAMTGVPPWSDKERVDRFGEFVAIVDQLLTHETSDYQGRYYQVTDARMRPGPVQQPRPPLTIAAAGPRTLQVAARYADSWNTFAGFGLSQKAALDVIRQRSDILDESCARIGRNPGAITRSFLAGLTTDTPFASLDAFYDFIGCYQAAGISEFIFYYDYPLLSPDRSLTTQSIERIALEAIPKIREKSGA